MTNKIEFFGKQRLTSLLNKLANRFKKNEDAISSLQKIENDSYKLKSYDIKTNQIIKFKETNSSFGFRSINSISTKCTSIYELYNTSLNHIVKIVYKSGLVDSMDAFAFYKDSSNSIYAKPLTNHNILVSGDHEIINEVPQDSLEMNLIFEKSFNVIPQEFSVPMAVFDTNSWTVVLKIPLQSKKYYGSRFKVIISAIGSFGLAYAELSLVNPPQNLSNFIVSTNRSSFWKEHIKYKYDGTMLYIAANYNGNIVYYDSSIVSSKELIDDISQYKDFSIINIDNVSSSVQLTNVELALAEMYEQNLKEES